VSVKAGTPPGTPGTHPEHPEPHPVHPEPYPEHPEPHPEHPEPHPEHSEPHREHAGIRAMKQRTCFSILHVFRIKFGVMDGYDPVYFLLVLLFF
jgi:hypothetical protein